MDLKKKKKKHEKTLSRRMLEYLRIKYGVSSKKDLEDYVECLLLDQFLEMTLHFTSRKRKPTYIT